jgi:hypothetical protein
MGHNLADGSADCRRACDTDRQNSGSWPKKMRAPPVFQRFDSVERGPHRLAIVDVARQPSLAQGLAEIVSVSGEHDLAAVEAQPRDWCPEVWP